MELFEADNASMDAYQSTSDIYSDGWISDVCQLFSEELTNDIIVQSVQDASDFFNIENPYIIAEGDSIGVYPNNECIMQDDVITFNYNQLTEMGISGRDGLDLVMTHECTHRVLQGMEHIGFNSHQEELCCDYMSGVRAGLNGIDVSQIENSLMYTLESETHPAGVDRVNAIESGVNFAQEYYAEYNMAPTFEKCLDNFCELNDINENKQQYNVSFGAQKETVTAKGGGLKLDITITKEPGHSNLYCIESSKGTVHNVKGGTIFVDINGISYKLPKLKG